MINHKNRMDSLKPPLALSVMYRGLRMKKDTRNTLPLISCSASRVVT